MDNDEKKQGSNKEVVQEEDTISKPFDLYDNKDRKVYKILNEICQMFYDNLNNRSLMKNAPSLGVVRLDYDYPPALGDVACSKSFTYNVYYRTVPGLTFEMCQTGMLTDKIRENFKDAILWLLKEKKVSAITGDCGFMMYYQPFARTLTNVPVFMSSLCQLPAVTCAFSSKEEIIILTANGKSLEPMSELIKKECGIDTNDDRYHIIGCEDVEGFEAVALGSKVNTRLVEPGIVNKALEALKKFPKSRAFLLECTECPPYSDAIRFATGLPVFDAITVCNFFMESLQDNERFGKQDWQHGWDGTQENYDFGQELTEAERLELISKPHPINRLKRVMDEIINGNDINRTKKIS